VASLLELLVSRQIISAEQAQEAAALADETGAFIGRILVSQGAVDEQLLARFLASECTESLGTEKPSVDVLLARLLPERLMRNYRMVPLSRSPAGILRLAVAEPLSIGGIDQVKRRLGMPVRLVLADADTVQALLEEVAPSSPGERGEVALTPVSLPREESTPVAAVAPAAAVSSATAPPPDSPVMSAVPGVLALNPRTVGERTEVPSGWHPSPIAEVLPTALEAAHESLRDLLGAGKKTFIVVVGPDAARDRVLRRLCATTARDRVLYVDLVAYCCPRDLVTSGLSVAVFDGIDSASADEEEEKNLLRAISTAYAAHTPMILGMRQPPKDSSQLSRGMRLTLGLAHIVTIEAVEGFETAGLQRGTHEILRSLMDETAEWSEAAFAGASLRPLMEATASVFGRGNRQGAVAKATTSVASRLSHLCGERGR
jgi:hypothetical protein